MWYLIMSIVGMVAGAVCAWLAMEKKRSALHEQQRQHEAREDRLQDTLRATEAKQQLNVEDAARTKAEQQAIRRELAEQIDRLKAERAAFDGRAVSYKELQDENAILKSDLRNIEVNVRKQKLDREVQQQAQEALDRRARDLAARYLKDNIKWIGSSLTQNNFVASKQRLQNVVKACRDIGFLVLPEEENGYVEDLKTEFEKLVRAAFEREEQARIRARIREEQKLQREVERELQQLERERAAIQAALDKALAEAQDEHSAEIEGLRARLAEAESKSQRAVSQAQMTKAGYVYVISNIGSFGEGTFKIGMTRRLEPFDRIRELGDASVPFPFDVHMMISSNDAPSLETALHRTLHDVRINKMNPRKEFFKTEIDAICRIVKENHGEVEYVADAEALQYRQSVTMSDEDQQFIEGVYDKLEDDGEAAGED